MSKILLADKTLCDKLKAHKEGLRHFAFSVFLFNSDNELLLQKRAKSKYHSGGLWSNACCSHFADKNELKNCRRTVKKRLLDELGIVFNGELKEIGIFEYNSDVGNDLIENEIDYIFSGFISDNECSNFRLNPDEVECVKFVDIGWLKDDIKIHPENYTKWLKLILDNKKFNLLLR